MGYRWLTWGMAAGMVVAGTVSSRAASDLSDRHSAAVPQRPLAAHPKVALTFDDLPAAGDLPPGETRTAILTRLAGELKANHLEGTYGFVTASDLTGDSDAQQALRVWVGAGMNIGNHTWSHPSLTSDSAASFEQNIERDDPALQAFGGRHDWHWFRYPYLEEGNTADKRMEVRDWLRAHGYRVAEVTLNFQDDDWDDAYARCEAQHNDAGVAWLRQSYMGNAAEFIRVGREEEQIAFGHEIPNVLLLHGTPFTTLMLPDLLRLLRQEGFRFEPLARVEKNAAYHQGPRALMPDGGSLPNEVLDARHLAYPAFTPEPVQRLNSICE